MSFQLFNSLTRTKQLFEPIQPGKVQMYVCGITPYADSHVGHACSGLVFDVLRRWLEYLGYEVRLVKNFTDVDDKIIARAHKDGVSAYEIADRYSRRFLLEEARLGIAPATINPRVSSDMPAIIAMVQKLVERGHAYPAPNGDVFFDISSFPRYGELSGQDLGSLKSQEDDNGHKKRPFDFALWKSAKLGEPSWQSPWGPGRPGWHIECSAMSALHLGEQIDIHGGGRDLVFPHHENEIAQSEGACGLQPFARFWVHNGLVRFGEEKMSKSVGNIVATSEFLEHHEADVLRLLVLSTHYRSPVNLSEQTISAAEKGLTRLRGALRPAERVSGSDHEAATLNRAKEETEAIFEDAMNDDLGTPQALAALFEFVTAINRAREAGVESGVFQAAQETLIGLAGVVGFTMQPATPPVQHSLGLEGRGSPAMDFLLTLREGARSRGNWEVADSIREFFGSHGLEVQDTARGPALRVMPTAQRESA